MNGSIISRQINCIAILNNLTLGQTIFSIQNNSDESFKRFSFGNYYPYISDQLNEFGEENCISKEVAAAEDKETVILLVLEIIAFGLMVLLTIGGNLLVVVAVVSSASLRTPTYTLIVNLAIADLLLGITVLPFSITREISGVWVFGPSLCSVWTTLDVFCCTASILSLCGISVDRYIGVSKPLAYTRILTKRRVRFLIAGIWTLALTISMAPSFGWHEESRVTVGISGEECNVNKQLGYVIFSACGSFYLPALVVLVLYTLVYRAAARHSHFMRVGSRVTRSDVTLRVHQGQPRSLIVTRMQPRCDSSDKVTFVRVPARLAPPPNVL